jgi:hypothetical protein
LTKRTTERVSRQMESPSRSFPSFERAAVEEVSERHAPPCAQGQQAEGDDDRC